MNPTKTDYLLLFRSDNWYDELPVEELRGVIEQNKAWFERLLAQGQAKAAQGLVRQGATVSQKRGSVTDGPFVESKEAIGGFLLLAADSFEEAMDVARSFPSLRYGTVVEVRPVAQECPSWVRLRELTEGPLASATV